MPAQDRAFTRNALILLGAGGAALLAVLVTALQVVEEDSRVTQRLNLSQATRSAARRLQSEMQDSETGQRGYLLTGTKAYLAPYEASRDKVAADLAALRAALAAEGQDADMPVMSRAIQGKQAELQHTIDLMAAGRADEAYATVKTNRGKAEMDTFRAEIGKVIDSADGRVTDNLAHLREAGVYLRWVTVGGGVLAVLFVGGSMILARRYTRALLAARRDLEALNQGLENRVRERTADLTRANEEIQRFAYIVSHDLRAPLVNIMGFTSELDEGLAELKTALRIEADDQAGRAGEPDLETAARVVAGDMPEAIGFVRSSTRKMDGLINAILRLSREGRRMLSPEPVDLNRLFTDQAESLRHQAEARGARITVEGPLPSIRSDRLALEQIFGNLLDNALKYLSPARPGDIRVRALSEAGRVTVEVADNGRGIARGDQERVFELFRRAGPQDQPGEGIGLAHVRALVRRLGGEITVESSTDEGSVFRVNLPQVLVADDEKEGEDGGRG